MSSRTNLPAQGDAAGASLPFSALLTEGAAALGIVVTPPQLATFEQLTAWLLDWNTRMNLTAVRDPQDIAVKHILDSLTCLQVYAFPEGAGVLDVGTGAGFPGIVLQIARPDLRVSFMDSTRKKLAFVTFIAQEMGWTHSAILALRAEEAGHDAAYREAFDVVAARAVAPLPILAELCIPYVRPGGVFLAMKGPNVVEEAPAAANALLSLGGFTQSIEHFQLPFGGGERAILVLGKDQPTPSRFPRLFRDIKRSPL